MEDREAALAAQFAEAQAKAQRARTQQQGGQVYYGLNQGNQPLLNDIDAPLFTDNPSSQDLYGGTAGQDQGAQEMYDEEEEAEEEARAIAEEEEQDAQEEVEAEEQELAFQEIQQRVRIAEEQARAEEEIVAAIADQQTSNETKKFVRKDLPKILNFLGVGVDGVAAISDTSTVGTSFIWDVFWYIARFFWLNTMMIYGYYISGYFINENHQSLLVPPLTWDQFNPIEDGFPVPLPDVFLHILLVMADLLLILAFIILLGMMAIFAIVVVDFWQNPTGTLYTIITNPNQLPYFRDIGSFLGL